MVPPARRTRPRRLGDRQPASGSQRHLGRVSPREPLESLKNSVGKSKNEILRINSITFVPFAIVGCCAEGVAKLEANIQDLLALPYSRMMRSIIIKCELLLVVFVSSFTSNSFHMR